MRVRTEARREAILETAAQAFMELGYEGASMAEIAARVGGSKGTLYSYFPSKEKLFMGVVAHKVGRKVDAAYQDMPSLANHDPRDVLCRLGEGILKAILTPEAVALKRLIVAHITNNAAGERFFALGPQQVVNTVEQYLAAATRAGKLAVPMPDVAARHMLALYEAEAGWRGPPGAELTWDRAQIGAAVARAVDVFLAAYGSSSAAS
jgi:AcrR family transcriptional regulator